MRAARYPTPEVDIQSEMLLYNLFDLIITFSVLCRLRPMALEGFLN